MFSLNVDVAFFFLHFWLFCEELILLAYRHLDICLIACLWLRHQRSVVIDVRVTTGD